MIKMLRIAYYVFYLCDITYLYNTCVHGLKASQSHFKSTPALEFNLTKMSKARKFELQLQIFCISINSQIFINRHSKHGYFKNMYD